MRTVGNDQVRPCRGDKHVEMVQELLEFGPVRLAGLIVLGLEHHDRHAVHREADRIATDALVPAAAEELKEAFGRGLPVQVKPQFRKMDVDVVGRLGVEPRGADDGAFVTGLDEPFHQGAGRARGAAGVVGIGVVDREQDAHVIPTSVDNDP